MIKKGIINAYKFMERMESGTSDIHGGASSAWSIGLRRSVSLKHHFRVIYDLMNSWMVHSLIDAQT